MNNFSHTIFTYLEVDLDDQNMRNGMIKSYLDALNLSLNSFKSTWGK